MRSHAQVSKVGPLAGSSGAQVASWEAQHALVQARPGALPPHRYIMMLEPFTWVINNNANGERPSDWEGIVSKDGALACSGNLTYGWEILNGTQSPPGAPSGGPSIRYSPLDGKRSLHVAKGRGAMRCCVVVFKHAFFVVVGVALSMLGPPVSVRRQVSTTFSLEATRSTSTAPKTS